MLLVPLFYSQERRNDFWSGLAVISVCDFLYNFIKSPKNGPAKTGPAGLAPTPIRVVVTV